MTEKFESHPEEPTEEELKMILENHLGGFLSDACKIFEGKQSEFSANGIQKHDILQALLEKEAESTGAPYATLSLFGDAVVKKINRKLGERLGLSVSDAELPMVVPQDPEEIGVMGAHAREAYNKKTGEKLEVNFITIPDFKNVTDGNTMGEEMAHFYRGELQPDEKEEKITSEFFGFLGRRMLACVVEGQDDELSALGFDDQNFSSKKEVVGAAKKQKTIIRKLRDEFDKEILTEAASKGAPELAQKLGISADRAFQLLLDKYKKSKDVKKLFEANERYKDVINAVNKNRTQNVAHQRGYEWASKIDMGRITDWKRLFSMPNTEVRKRFFTDKPDYSGL